MGKGGEFPFFHLNLLTLDLGDVSFAKGLLEIEDVLDDLLRRQVHSDHAPAANGSAILIAYSLAYKCTPNLMSTHFVPLAQ